MYHSFSNSIDTLAFVREYNSQREEFLAKIVCWPYVGKDHKFMVFCPINIKKDQ